MGYTGVTFNSIPLFVINLNSIQRQKTLKQTVGKQVIILGAGLHIEELENVITIQGQIRGANLDTDRTNLIAARDGRRHSYTDGVHDGDYAITDLQFRDEGGTAGITKYDYTMTLVEW